jgi:hypothetical protein
MLFLLIKSRNRDNPSIAVPSGGIQSMLEEADADVLLLLDCCHSAAVPTTDCQQRTGGVVEVIAACGYETVAAEVDQHSFTKALTDILAMASKGRPFSVGELHSRVLSRLKCWTPQLATDGEGKYIENADGRLLYERQPRRTPIYSILCETMPRRSIVLGPLSDLSSCSSSDYDQETLSSNTSSTTSPPLSGSDEECDSPSESNHLTAERCGVHHPQVLLAIRLDEDRFDLQAWIEWVRNAPPDAKDIRVEGTYDSFSTLVLLRMPVTTWNLLPDNPAYSFVGFVTSRIKLPPNFQHDDLVPCSLVQLEGAPPPPSERFSHDVSEQLPMKPEGQRNSEAVGAEGSQSYENEPDALDLGLKDSCDLPLKTSKFEETHHGSRVTVDSTLSQVSRSVGLSSHVNHLNIDTHQHRPSTSVLDNASIPATAVPAELNLGERQEFSDSDFEIITMASLEQMPLTENSSFSISTIKDNETLNNSATIPDGRCRIDVIDNDSWSRSSTIESGDTFSIDSSTMESSDTHSTNTVVANHRFENGRRYHAYKDGAYWAPNDDEQNDNLYISHYKFHLLLGGKLHLAPLQKNTERVLDIGTGTGIWAIDFADQSPSVDVYGTDLSPIQPNMIPVNCKFAISDARDQWVYPPNYFDFVHIRALLGSIGDWPAFYKQAYRHLKPGAYIEHIEVSIDIKSDDGTVGPDSPLVMFSSLFAEAGQITGQTFRVSDIMKEEIQAAGFVKITEKVYKTPIGSWPVDPKLKELGKWALLGFDIGLEGFAMAILTRALGWSPDEVRVFLTRVRAAARDQKIHSYHDIKLVYAQKPLTVIPCEVCGDVVKDGEEYGHRQGCDGNDYDICRNCLDAGRICAEHKHELEKRVWRDPESGI